jgi:predicted nucleotidyltransferase
MVIGGVAVIAQGSERVTTDVDATVLLGRLSLDIAIEVFRKAGFSGREPELAAFARETGVLLLRHDRSATSVDVSLADLPFEERALQRAEMVTLGGVEIRVAHPADLIIYKMVAHRTRDLDDAEAMLRLHLPRINLAEVEASIQEFSTLLEDAAPLDAWREVKRRARLE